MNHQENCRRYGIEIPIGGSTLRCTHCGVYILLEENAGSDIHPLCPACFKEHYTSCTRCGTLLRREAVCYTNEDTEKKCPLCDPCCYALSGKKKDFTYQELKKLFCAHEQDNPSQHLTAHIVFTAGSFDKPYPLCSRTYCVSSNNKAFRPGMGGYSIFAYCLDGTDPCVRLEGYMSEERGGPNGWKVEFCYLTED